MSYLKAENINLKKKIQTLEDRLLNIVGSIKIFASGMAGSEHFMNNHIADILTTGSELKIVAPYITEEYMMVLQDRVRSGIPVQICMNDRRAWPKEAIHFYDKIKATPGLDLINNPNVKYLMVWSPEKALISSGPLDKKSLESTVLIGTLLSDPKKIEELLLIFKEMLPSFMR